ncbi:MAG: hypothetical protein EXR71_17770 [Myxococcales bacterium]|nr:hypothetical protein [Myxococcales bacterium]
MPLLPSLALVLGCQVTADDLPAVPTIPAAAFEAPPPTADGAEQERLFQVLYAGEVGDQSFEAGQRVRVRAWLASMGFSANEREALTVAMAAIAKQLELANQEERQFAEAESAQLLPIYAEIEAGYASGQQVTEDEMAGWSKRLTAARVAAYGEGTPASVRQARVRSTLDAVAPFVSQLSEDGRARMAAARFFLVRRVSPIGRVGAYHALVGLDWDGGEFPQLNEETTILEQPHMDIGGLWALEKYRGARPGTYLTGRQVQAIVIMACLEPALVEALGPPG